MSLTYQRNSVDGSDNGRASPESNDTTGAISYDGSLVLGGVPLLIVRNIPHQAVRDASTFPISWPPGKETLPFP